MAFDVNNIVELRNHLVFAERCFYNLDSGNYQIKTIKNIIPQNLGDGIFVTIEENLYALVKTVNGPMFIYNDLQFVLKKIRYEFYQKELSYGDSKRTCRFIFLNDGKEIVNIIYKKPPGDWSFWDIDTDFFHWLVNFSHSAELINRWTK